MTANLDSPSHGHLGTAWEIAVVVVFIILIVVLVTTVVLQMRKKQRRKQQRALGRSLDVERGREARGSTSDSPGTAGEKCPDRSHSGMSASDAVSVNAETAAGPAELSQPSPTAQPKRLSRSSYHEYISRKPPKYYWDQR